MTAAARKAFEEAVALENSGKLDKALVSYLKAQELSPDDTEIAYRTASALLQAGYLEEAQSQLRRIVFAEPDHLGARASLGNCQLLMGDTANAKQNFQDVLMIAPDNRNALYGLASVYLKDGQPSSASEPAKRLLDLLPDSPAVLTVFAQTQAGSDRHAAGIAAYRKALKADPSYLPAILGLSEALLLRKRYDEVIELTIRANELSPADSLPLELLSDALSGKGAMEDAREAAEEALKLNGRSVPVFVRLSVLARKLGDTSAALRYALAGYDIDNMAREPLNALGAVLAALKYSGQARAVLTGLSAGKELDPEIRKFVEKLILAEAQKPSPVAPAASEQTEQPAGSPLKDELENDATGGPREKPARASEEVEPGVRRTNEKPVAKFLSPEPDQLPNVLGLQRQDKS